VKIAAEVVVTIQVLAFPTLGINRALYLAALSDDSLVHQPSPPMRMRGSGKCLGSEPLTEGNQSPTMHEIEGK
jgi:hypothetical protein